MVDITRRTALRYGAAVTVGGLLPRLLRGLDSQPASAAASCTTLTPDMTEGPYWVDLDLHRSDITANTSDASTDPGVVQDGVPLTLTINVVDASNDCAAYNNCYVDIWHANAYGIYSDEASQQAGGGDSTTSEDTTGENFLRGYQITGVDAATGGQPVDGQVVFSTIWPGWYTSRAIHIHVRVRTYDSSGSAVTNYTTQIFFSDSDNDEVLSNASPYNTRTTIEDPTTDENDTVLTSSAYSTNIVSVSGSVSDGYTATFDITIDEGTTDSEGGSGGTPPGTPSDTTTTTTAATTTTAGSTGTTTGSESASSVGSRLTASLSSVRIARGRHGTRRLAAKIKTSERVTANAQIRRHGKRLAGSHGYLSKGSHDMHVTIPKTVTTGAATLIVHLTDHEGHTRRFEHKLHIPPR